MGVRLVRFDQYGRSKDVYAYDHDELINRDMMNQHPIYAIIGLQEVLNILEDSIGDINQYLLEHAIEDIETGIVDINSTLDDIYDKLSKLKIQQFKDTDSIQMVYDEDTQTLMSNVRVHTDKLRDNMLQILPDGLYVPSPITQNTSTVSWQKIAQAGVTYNIQEMFNNGMTISHHFESWSTAYNAADCQGWTYDATNKRIVHLANTESMAGFLMQDFYDYYRHDVTLSSTDSDNDVMGVIIAYAIDEDGHPHTLSIVYDKQSSANNYVLWYDYDLPDQEKILSAGNGALGTKPSGNALGSWSSSTGITVQINKDHEIVEVISTNWGNGTLNEATKMSIDLYDYAWGHYFIGAVQIGYMAHSQSNAYFKIVTFNAHSNPNRYNLTANVRVSADTQNEIIIKSDGIFAPKFNISAQAGNGLIKNADGYYVRAAISKDANNALEAHTDGLYTRDYRNVRVVTKTSHGFIVGDFIYYHPTSGYLKAKAIDNYDINIIGMVTKVIDVNNFEYQWSGFFPTTLFTATNGYTQGMPLYISNITAGKVTQTQPDISKAVGYPVENLGLIISIERGVQYNQEAKIGDMKTSANDYNVRSDGFIRVVEEVDYKKTLIYRLLDTLSNDFKSKYLEIDDQSVRFINVFDLYNAQKVPYGLNLFIKAF